MAASNWGDLKARILTSIALMVIGGMGIWAGGMVFHLLVAVICGAMAWEMARMTSPQRPQDSLVIAGGVSLVILLWPGLPLGVMLIALLALAGGAAWRAKRYRGAVAGFVVMIVVAGLGLLMLRLNGGIAALLWLICVVIATDVLGYFAGRAIGGPKFWPRVSPKKTWSGTSAGWVGAALVGLLFMRPLGMGADLLLLSIGASMASQAGDLLESAYKRRCEVKDSSNLLPGHGGVWDRFDGMIGAALFVSVILALLFGTGFME